MKLNAPKKILSVYKSNLTREKQEGRNTKRRKKILNHLLIKIKMNL